MSNNEQKQQQKYTFQSGNYKPYKNFYEMYHGCGLVHEDGTRVVLMQKEKYKIAMCEPFWKLPEHVGNQVETRIIKMRKKMASKSDLKKYFQSINQ